jgi:O-antigen/teichoic acid export membrane protein
MIPEANSILRIHSFLPTIFTLSNIIGLFVLACIGKDKIYSYILTISAVLATTLHFKLVYKYNAIGAAMAILYGETFTLICVLLCAWPFIRKNN